MATLKSIRKRIVSVKNTQKITRAMKMVAAAKLRRAQAAVQGSRPYVKKVGEIVRDIAGRLPEKDLPGALKAHESTKRVAVYVFTSNRGLCGGFNSNLLRKSDTFLKDLRKDGIEFELTVIGRKGRDFFTARKITPAQTIPQWAESLSYDDALKLSHELVEKFNNGAIDKAYFCYNEFVSAMTQNVAIEPLLPIPFEKTESVGVDFIYEPSRKEILSDLLPKFLAGRILVIHKESLASELGARMSAMDSATKNASEMIGSLTLKYNRARQAAITTELMDIVNGAESLKA